MPKCALLALDISGFRVKLLDNHRMAGSPYDPSRAPVAYGRRAVPQLFSELQQQEAPRRLRALASLCDLLRDPERISCAVSGGNEQPVV